MCVEAFDLSTAEVRSLDFVINRFFMKLFKTTTMEIIQLCQTYLCFELPSVLLKKRTEKFRKKYNEYHYIHYDKLCKLLNIMSVSLLSFSIVVYF